jgi:hypothetical protein
MNKIYYVIIKGRTFESRNLKQLLARAVAEKRNLDRKSKSQIHQPVAIDDSTTLYGNSCQMVVH